MQLPVFKRNITHNIIERLLEERHVIQVIIGPRQVGKTTAIHQALREVNISNHYAAADLPAPPATEWIAQQWDIARRKLLNETKVILVLDEIQKVSNWSIEVKRLWDEDTRLGNNYIRDSIIETAISKDILLLSPIEKPALLR